ncbi:MAG: hypothetical protein ABJA60_01855, partial [Nitrosospira sp.]
MLAASWLRTFSRCDHVQLGFAVRSPPNLSAETELHTNTCKILQLLRDITAWCNYAASMRETNLCFLHWPAERQADTTHEASLPEAEN